MFSDKKQGAVERIDVSQHGEAYISPDQSELAGERVLLFTWDMSIYLRLWNSIFVTPFDRMLVGFGFAVV